MNPESSPEGYEGLDRIAEAAVSKLLPTLDLRPTAERFINWQQRDEYSPEEKIEMDAIDEAFERVGSEVTREGAEQESLYGDFAYGEIIKDALRSHAEGTLTLPHLIRLVGEANDRQKILKNDPRIELDNLTEDIVDLAAEAVSENPAVLQEMTQLLPEWEWENGYHVLADHSRKCIAHWLEDFYCEGIDMESLSDQVRELNLAPLLKQEGPFIDRVMNPRRHFAHLVHKAVDMKGSAEDSYTADVLDELAKKDEIQIDRRSELLQSKEILEVIQQFVPEKFRSDVEREVFYRLRDIAARGLVKNADVHATSQLEKDLRERALHNKLLKEHLRIIHL